jgi:hypothetical protein
MLTEQSYRSRSKQRDGLGEASKQSYRSTPVQQERLLPSEGHVKSTRAKDIKEQSYRSRSKQRNGAGEASEQSYRFHRYESNRLGAGR